MSCHILTVFARFFARDLFDQRAVLPILKKNYSTLVIYLINERSFQLEDFSSPFWRSVCLISRTFYLIPRIFIFTSREYFAEVSLLSHPHLGVDIASRADNHTTHPTSDSLCDLDGWWSVPGSVSTSKKSSYFRSPHLHQASKMTINWRIFPPPALRFLHPPNISRHRAE